MKYLAVLGRIPELSLAELMSLYGDVESRSKELAVFESAEKPEIARLGGTLKLAEELPDGFNYLVDALSDLPDGKITLGISDYRRKTSIRKAQGEALKIKKILQRRGRSVRVLENKLPVLSTATSHHNQLAEKKNHVEIIMTDFGNFNLIGVQNISDYAKRDQARPARDAKVGMLPPKLAQILINLSGVLPEGAKVLDPFCGTGVVLQEAFLMGYQPYGTDLSERMVDYTKRNLDWIGCKNCMVECGDAMKFEWVKPIDAVVAEAFLGQPMSQPPADIKLKQEKMRCKDIIIGFLKNLYEQVESGTPVVLAAPAWLRPSGEYSRLNILDEVEDMGYNVKKFINLGQSSLLYFREGQVVAREIIVLRKK